MRFLRICAVALLAVPSFIHAQQQMPRDYRGVQVIVPGIFVTPVTNAPFSANVETSPYETAP